MNRRWLWLVVGVVLAPESALACASCVWSPFGDRSYNWAFLGLILLPFAVVGVVGGLIVRELRRTRHAAQLASEAGAEGDPGWAPATIEERT